MISDQVSNSLIDQIVKGLIGQGSEGFKSVFELLFNTAMKVERERFRGAGAHERYEERKGYANGLMRDLSQRFISIFYFKRLTDLVWRML